MSNTQYGRQHQMRFDDLEKHVLARAIMNDLQKDSTWLAEHPDEATDAQRQWVRTQRSLLERLTT